MHFVKEKVAKSLLFISILLICIGVIAVILFGVQQFKISSQLASVNQVSNLSHLLIRQQANLFSMMLVNNAKQETLVDNLEILIKEGFILDASVYNNKGELLAQTRNSGNLRQQLGLEKDENIEKDEMNSRQIVEPIYSADGLAGFLRVTFDSKYGQTTQNKINQIFHKLYGELMIILLAGILLASSSHYFISHYRRVKSKYVETMPTDKAKVSPKAISFHRRRRRFKSF